MYYVDLHLKPRFPAVIGNMDLHKYIVGAGMGGLGCALALLWWPRGGGGVSSTSAPMRLPRP
jgi:hypothetical protein